MAEHSPTSSGRRAEPFEIDTHNPQPARVQNYLSGGDDNFPVDRKLADYLSSTSPVEFDTARASVQAISAFVLRAVRYLAGEVGIRQFLVTTTAIPTKDNIHEVAQGVAPDARVVYVGQDPVVMAHAHSLRESTPEGAAAYIEADLRELRDLLEQAATTLDFTRPVAVLVPSTLNFITDEDDAHGIMSRLLSAMPSGSHLVIAHTTSDIQTELITDVAERLSDAMGVPYVLRTHAEIAKFFDGLEMVDTGLVHIDEWRRHENDPVPEAEKLIPIFGGVGRKP